MTKFSTHQRLLQEKQSVHGANAVFEEHHTEQANYLLLLITLQIFQKLLLLVAKILQIHDKNI